MSVKKFFIALLFLGFLNNLYAKAIPIEKAKENALQWLEHRGHHNYKINKEISVNQFTKSTAKTKGYKLFQLDPKGWVIISLDDTIEPVIGYGDSLVTQKLPPAFIDYLGNIQQTIDYLNSHPKVQNNRNNFKSIMMADDYNYTARPLLWLGSNANTEAQGIRWNQGRYYNDMTPVDEDGDHTPTGCVATAMGQIMRYYEYPTSGQGEHCYTPATHPEYGEQCADFETTEYDWENMPLRLDSNNSAVAEALYHAGVAVNMDYAPEGSGAWLGDKLKVYFKYKLSILLRSDEFSSNEWHMILKNELNSSRPVVYGGGNPNGGGHQFIVDGYDSDGYYHINWGWGGFFNGKFILSDIRYSLRQTAYILAPTDPSAQVVIADSNFSGCIIEELNLESSADIKELTVKYAKSLYCGSQDINTIDGISHFKNLKYLYLYNNNLNGYLDLSSLDKLNNLDLGSNQISTLKLSNTNNDRYLVNISYNPVNILNVLNLKNITKLYAYGTTPIACWKMNALKAKNNISNIYMTCTATSSDNLDSDNDGIKNVDDPDDDNDGKNDLIDNDIDGDGISNADENEWNFNPLDPRDANKDADGDGISNKDEINAGTDPYDPNNNKPKKFIPIVVDDLMVIVPKQ